MPPSHQRLATTRDNRPSPTVSVVIPALNEETNLPLVLEGLPPVDEVVIVDGGSADDTVAIAREVRPDAVVVRQTRHGKGNALVCGFAAASGDIVVTLNADGSTDPGELSRFVDALISGAEVAHGSRFRDGGSDLGGQRLDRLGNAILSRFVNALFGTRFTDVEYGYNAYWRALLPALNLPGADIPGLRRGGHVWGDGSEIEPLLNIRVAAQGMRVVEVSSIGYPPINGVRHHEGWERALRATRVAFGEYLRHRRQSRRPVPAPATARLRSRPALPAAGRVDTGSMHVRDLALGQGQTHPRGYPGPDGRPDSQRYPEPPSRPREMAVAPSRPLDTGVHGAAHDTGRPRLLSDSGRHRSFDDHRSLDSFDDHRSLDDARRPRSAADGSSGGHATAHLDSGSHALADTGSGHRHLPDDTGGGHRAPGRNSGDRRRAASGEDSDGGRRSPERPPEIVATPPTRPDWRESTDTGQWRDLTSAARPARAEGQMYDPAAEAQHDLDPAARRSLPMYPKADPVWTETSGRHAVVEPTEERRPDGRSIGRRRIPGERSTI